MFCTDELEILERIIAKVSGVSGWAFLGYVVYMALKTLLIYGGLFWLIHAIAKQVFSYLKMPLNRKEYEAERKKSVRDFGEMADRNSHLNERITTLEREKHTADTRASKYANKYSATIREHQEISSDLRRQIRQLEKKVGQ